MLLPVLMRLLENDIKLIDEVSDKNEEYIEVVSTWSDKVCNFHLFRCLHKQGNPVTAKAINSKDCELPCSFFGLKQEKGKDTLFFPAGEMFRVDRENAVVAVYTRISENSAMAAKTQWHTLRGSRLVPYILRDRSVVSIALRQHVCVLVSDPAKAERLWLSLEGRVCVIGLPPSNSVTIDAATRFNLLTSHVVLGFLDKGDRRAERLKEKRSDIVCHEFESIEVCVEIVKQQLLRTFPPDNLVSWAVLEVLDKSHTSPTKRSIEFCSSCPDFKDRGDGTSKCAVMKREVCAWDTCIRQTQIEPLPEKELLTLFHKPEHLQEV